MNMLLIFFKEVKMASKSSGGFSIGSVIFLIFMYNIFFGDDDNSKDVDLVVDSKPAVEQPADESVDKIKEDLKGVLNDVKQIAKELKDDVIKDLEESADAQKQEKIQEDEVKEPEPETPKVEDPPVKKPKKETMKKL